MRKNLKAVMPWLFLLGVLVGAAWAGATGHPIMGLTTLVMGTVSFNHIPADIRVPLFYAEMDNSAANTLGSGAKRVLVIGQMFSTGSAAPNKAIMVPSTPMAKGYFGQGSMLARMHEYVRKIDSFIEVWCIGLSDVNAGASASGTVTVTGPASAAGTVNLYIAGQRVQVGVAAADTAAMIAGAIVAAVAANEDLPVTAAANGAQVTLTCRWKGASGNDISIQDSFRGSAGGEALPDGVGLQYSAGFLSGGATDPELNEAILAMGDEEYDFVIHPYTDSANLDDLDAEYNDSTGRWAWSRMIYGHCYSAKRGLSSDLVTFGKTRNGPHQTIAGFEKDVPNPVWEYAASYGARNASFIAIDPARPTQTGELTGILAPRVGDRFLLTERQSLLSYGIATSYVSNGTVCIERAITTYQRNAYGQADDSYLDSETLHTNAELIRRLRTTVTSKYGRHKLANDGTVYGAGQAIVTPSVIRGELIAGYAKAETDGLVENADLFAKYLIVERDGTDPNRVNVLYPPDLINQLRIFALLNQFRLQYPANA